MRSTESECPEITRISISAIVTSIVRHVSNIMEWNTSEPWAGSKHWWSHHVLTSKDCQVFYLILLKPHCDHWYISRTVCLRLYYPIWKFRARDGKGAACIGHSSWIWYRRVKLDQQYPSFPSHIHHDLSPIHLSGFPTASPPSPDFFHQF